MKNRITILFAMFCIITSHAFSQKSGTIYNLSNYANPNDTFRFSQGNNFIKLNFDTTGQNITWDYSSIQSNTQDVIKILAPNQSGYIFTPVSFQQKLDIAIPTIDTLYLNTIKIYDVLGFFDKANNQLSQLAIAGKVQGFAVKSKYDTPDIVYNFPIQYGNQKDSSSSSYTVSIPTMLYYKHSQKRVNSVEGYGTLKTPFGTFDVIKTKSIIYSTDTVSISNSGVPSYKYTNVIYQWLTPSKGMPVLAISRRIADGIMVSEKAEFMDSIRKYPAKASFVYSPLKPKQGDKVIFQNLSSNAITLSYIQKARSL